MPDKLERRIDFVPAYDERHRDCGIHGVEMRWFVVGERGAIQWVVATNWQLPHVQKEMDARPPSRDFPYLFHEPSPFDLGYHSPKPMYDGQRQQSDDCFLLHGPCYYDGSPSNAKPIMDILRTSGSEAVWIALEAEYARRFHAEKAEGE